jgi:colanic acid/amylovoran biosynthesis glycosyltransferase
MSRLLMLPPAPIIEVSDTEVRLDAKFAAGMTHHCALWPGRLICVMRRGARDIPFGAIYRRDTLPFELVVIDSDARLPHEVLRNADIIYCSADIEDYLDLPARLKGGSAKLVYVLEYTLETRLRVVLLDETRSVARRLSSLAWNLRREFQRRRALRQAHGVQVNGSPAFEVYRRLNPNTLLYLDNRMGPGMFANDADMEARAAHLKSGAPLRLIHSGRLEPMKGAQDLVPFARRLLDSGVAFTFDIYGAGSLRDRIAGEIEAQGLASCVSLHPPVDFETQLVPLSRRNADIFISCHRQSDPSCTYMEAMGCGLAIVGYDNRMWRAMAHASKGGWAEPLGRPDALAGRVAQLDKARDQIAACCRAARDFAAGHDFERVMAQRMAHLRALLPAPSQTVPAGRHSRLQA